MNTAEKVLYVFAHQDDEALIIVKMARDARRGRDVHAMWITDGAFTIPAEVREKESRCAMDLIGVPQENLHFLGYPDAASFRYLEDVYGDAMDVAERLQPVEVTSNAYEGGHVDHDAASIIAALIARDVPSCRRHYEFPSYNMLDNRYRVGQFLPRGDNKTFIAPVDGEFADLKMRALDMYPSQAHIIETLKTIADIESIIKSGEPYRIAPEYDYTERPIAQMLAYEFLGPVPIRFEEFRGAVVGFLERHGNHRAAAVK